MPSVNTHRIFSDLLHKLSLEIKNRKMRGLNVIIADVFSPVEGMTTCFEVASHTSNEVLSNHRPLDKENTHTDARNQDNEHISYLGECQRSFISADFFSQLASNFFSLSAQRLFISLAQALDLIRRHTLDREGGEALAFELLLLMSVHTHTQSHV